jgi:hypothetical protein
MGGCPLFSVVVGCLAAGHKLPGSGVQIPPAEAEFELPPIEQMSPRKMTWHLAIKMFFASRGNLKEAVRTIANYCFAFSASLLVDAAQRQQGQEAPPPQPKKKKK